MPPFFDGKSTTHRRSRFSVVGPNIHAIKFSSTGKFVAIGNDRGVVEIKNTTDTWDRIRIYTTTSEVRSLCWHPSEDILFMGVGNGNIYKVTLHADETRDDVCCGQVPGFIHTMSLNKDGSVLAVVYGATIAFIRNPFQEQDDEVGHVNVLHTEPLIDPHDPTIIPIALGLHFIDDDSLVVTFTATSGIRVYSLSTRREIQLIDTNARFLGRSALSPSGRRLAVLNPRIGIDWFSFSHGRYLSTSRYSTDVRLGDGNRFNQLAFVDEDTVVIAHKTGSLYFISFGMSAGPSHVTNLGPTPLQTLTFAHIPGHEHPIVVAIIPNHENPAAGSAIVVDILLTDPDRSRITFGPAVEHDVNTGEETHMQDSALGFIHPNIQMPLKRIYSQFKVVLNLRVGASILIAIFAVWTATSYYSRSIPQHPLVSPARLPSRQRSIHTTTNTVTVVRTRHITTTSTAMQTRLATTTSTAIQTEFVTTTATSIQMATSTYTRACECSSYTTTTTSTLTMISRDARNELSGVPSSCVCSLSGSIAMGTASPIAIALQVKQDMVVEGNIGTI